MMRAKSVVLCGHLIGDGQGTLSMKGKEAAVPGLS